MSELNQSILEIGKTVLGGSIKVNYHDYKEKDIIVFIRSSSPGATDWANWRLVLRKLISYRRIDAPDIVSVGYLKHQEIFKFNKNTWGKKLIDFLDALNLGKINLVGDSFGGALALWIDIHYLLRVFKLTIISVVRTNFKIAKGLDNLRGYQPSVEAMHSAINSFIYDNNTATEDLMKMSSEKRTRPFYQATLFQFIPNAQLHMFIKCGHWTKIEQNASFMLVIENEFVFVLSRELGMSSKIRVQDILDSTEYIIASQEIVDTRINDFQIVFLDTVSDNALSSMYVLDDVRKKISEFDLKNETMDLYKNGHKLNCSAETDVLGDLAHCIVWLANSTRNYLMLLKNGKVILLGVFSADIAAEKHDIFKAVYSSFSQKEAKFY